MSQLLINGHGLTIADIAAVARHPGTLRPELADVAVHQMSLSEELKTKLAV